MLLPILADHLERAGFVLSVDWHLSVRELRRYIPEDAPEEQWRDALCAITASDPESQVRFHQLYEEAKREWALREKTYNLKPPVSTGKSKGDGPDPPPPPKWPPWAKPALLAVSLLLAGALVWWWMQRPAPEDTVSSTVVAKAGRNSLIAPDTTVLRGFGMPVTSIFDAADSVRTTALANYSLRDSGRIFVQPRGVAGADTLRIHLGNSAGRTRVWQLVVQLQEGGSVRQQPGPDTVQGREITHVLRYLPDYRVQRDSLLLQRKAPDTSNLQAWLAAWHWPLKAALLLLLAAALYAWVLRRERRRPLTAARERADQPPFVWNIRLDDGDAPDPGDAFYALANRLRRRESAGARRLDLPRTVQATIDRGGLPTFRYRELTRPPEYLLLIDQYNDNDHRAALFDTLAQALRQQEVLLDRFFFGDDPRLCWNEEHPAGLGIRELLYRYPGARLLILGDGYRLLNPGTGQLAAWTQLLTAWKQRALLSPLPPADWGLPERRLAGRFAVLPARIDSLGYLADADEHFETGLFALQPADTTPAGPAADVAVRLGGPLIATLRQHYTAAELRWIAACAIWPSLHFDLTCWLGRRILYGDGFAHSRLPSAKNITTEALRRLAGLEWFVQGRIPDHDRLTLLEWLEQDSPGLLRRIQAALYRLLSAQKVPEMPVAAAPAYRLHLALLGWMGADDPAERARLAAEAAKWLSINRKPDVTALKALRRPRTLLDVLVPPQLRRRIHPGGFPALGWTPFWRDAGLAALVWTGALAAALIWQPRHPESCPPEQQASFRGQTLCLPTPADQTLYRERIACDSVTASISSLPSLSYYFGSQAAAGSFMAQYGTFSSTQFSFVDSLTAATRSALPPGDTTRLAYERYVATALFNAGVRLAHRADTAMQEPRLGAPSQFVRNAACAIFNKVKQIDSTLAELQATADWCSGNIARPTDRYADQQTRYLVSAFRELFGQKGYIFEENYVNIIAFRRTMDRVPDAWDDNLIVLYRDANSLWRSQIFIATTQAGLYYIQNPPTTLGAATIAAGQYPDSYTPGFIRQSIPVLRQTGTITIWRDRNKNGTYELAVDPQETGNAFSLHIQGTGGTNRPDRVGKYSAGAIVLPDTQDWATFQALFQKAYAKEKRPFNLTIFTQNDDLKLAELFYFHNAYYYSKRLVFDVNKDTTGISAFDLAIIRRALLSSPRNRVDTTITKSDQFVFSPDTTSIQDETETITATAYRPGRRPAEDMAFVRGGVFTMGCLEGRDQNCEDDEKPAHEVELNDFYIDRTEVTNAQYAAFLNEYGSEKVRAGANAGQEMVYEDNWGVQKDAKGQWQPAKGYENHPAVYVTWYGADEYARFYGLRLPTEAEWEYAARGGAQNNGYRYSGSNDLDEVGWYSSNSGSETHPVRGKKANELGLFDMSGNVWEWCADWYDEKYYEKFRTSRAINPTGPAEGDRSVLRGGSWDDYVTFCRPANRIRLGRNVRDYVIGFRCARVATAGGR